MFGTRRQTSLRSFLLGGLLGGVAGMFAAGRLRRSRGGPEDIEGITAFEDAPCHIEWRAREEAGGPAGEGREAPRHSHPDAAADS